MQGKQACFIVATVYQGYSAISMAKEALKLEYNRVYLLDCTKDGVFSKRHDGWLSGMEVVNLAEFYEKSFYARCVFSRFLYSKLLLEVFSKIDSLYIYNDRDPFSLYVSKKVRRSGGYVVLVEEGLSMYRMPVPALSWQAIKDLAKNIVFIMFSNTLLNFRFGFSQHLHEIMLSDPAEFNRKFPENKKRLTYYKMDFCDDFMNGMFINEYVEPAFNKESFCARGKIFLYLGQPLSELNILNKKDELRLIDEVKGVAESKGYSFILKPHPADIKGKYSGLGIRVFESIIPVEAILNIYGIDAVGSFSSSALYNMANNRGVKVFMLSNLLGMNYAFPINDRVLEVDSLTQLERSL